MQKQWYSQCCCNQCWRHRSRCPQPVCTYQEQRQDFKNVCYPSPMSLKPTAHINVDIFTHVKVFKVFTTNEYSFTHLSLFWRFHPFQIFQEFSHQSFQYQLTRQYQNSRSSWRGSRNQDDMYKWNSPPCLCNPGCVMITIITIVMMILFMTFIGIIIITRTHILERSARTNFLAELDNSKNNILLLFLTKF